MKRHTQRRSSGIVAPPEHRREGIAVCQSNGHKLLSILQASVRQRCNWCMGMYISSFVLSCYQIMATVGFLELFPIYDRIPSLTGNPPQSISRIPYRPRIAQYAKIPIAAQKQLCKNGMCNIAHTLCIDTISRRTIL